MRARWFIPEDSTMISEICSTAEQKMQKSVEVLKADLAKVRTGRAHTGLLDHVMVEYYGNMVPVNQVANVTLIDSRTIGVQPWEKPMVQKVERAIRDSDLGLNPANQGDLIRVPMPALTEERRRDLTKVVKNEGETAKVAIRNLRRDANQHFKDAVKDKLISEDDERRGQDAVQKLTDKYVAEVDRMLAEKEQELMQI
jgi:ribosome recycling factor